MTLELRLKQIQTQADIEEQILRAKRYVSTLRRKSKNAFTLQDKLNINEKVKEAERVLWRLRRSVFDIEDALLEGLPAISVLRGAAS